MDKNIVWHDGKITADDRQKLLNQKGVVVWFTGLSGSGKSTIAVELEKQLHDKGRLVYRLDGDNIRHGLNADLGFSAADRKENIRRTTHVSNLFKDAGVIVLASFISPHQEMRDYARKVIGRGDFIEVYIKASLKSCQQRDPKGYYRKVASGEITQFTGISSDYEEPIMPDIMIDTDKTILENAVNIIMSFLDAS